MIGRALRLARTLGAGSVLVYAMLGVVALLVLPPGPVNVPGRPGVVAVVWTLVAVLPAIAGATALSRVGDSEVISARGFPVVCLALLGWSTLAAAPLAALALATARPEVVRNLALLGAVAIILTRLVGLRSCWIAVVLYAGASWLLGVDQLRGHAAAPTRSTRNPRSLAARWTGHPSSAVIQRARESAPRFFPTTR